ncbi:programmed cell death 2 like trus [Osmia lignaria lignaria]|uniref:programmed cell death 2 like trus n=1 Tax=Osmia lignaria lignaria TaxID=1437193 RepID=UPI001478D278|nr:programmed cell death protein 2-like [Osmia lignaria]
MACDNRPKVYLGYEDEYVTDKHRPSITFMTNKIGGFPNCYEKNILSIPQCRLCRLYQLLALQLYVPLDNSKYHRTLYIFTCINPNCWNQNESWTCLRVQVLEDEYKSNALDSSTIHVPSTTSWLSDADDWGDNNLNDNSEQNGNNLLSNNATDFKFGFEKEVDKNIREEFSALHVDDPNANSPTSVESPVGIGAVGRLDSPQASAEIDGEESEVVCIDSPVKPQCDLISLLREVTPFPIQIESNTETKLSFAEIFLSVEEEDYNADLSQHIRDLIVEYQYRNPDLSTKSVGDSTESKTIETDSEKYEKGIPMHGDEMFHNFISQIQKNPGQLLRYSRDNSAPLILYPISGYVGKCQHCGSEMTFEVQILPTLISKLILQPRTEKNFQIEFGTVLIYTCVRSCWSPMDLYREEHVIVQAERL